MPLANRRRRGREEGWKKQSPKLRGSAFLFLYLFMFFNFFSFDKPEAFEPPLPLILIKESRLKIVKIRNFTHSLSPGSLTANETRYIFLPSLRPYNLRLSVKLPPNRFTIAREILRPHSMLLT